MAWDQDAVTRVLLFLVYVFACEPPQLEELKPVKFKIRSGHKQQAFGFSGIQAQRTRGGLS